MIIQFASDLHLEFSQNKDFIKANPLKPIGEVLILAGDIVPFAVMDKHKDFFSYVSDHFRHTFWIPGNHEYYYFDLAKKFSPLNEKIRRNVQLVNNITINHEKSTFIFSTLWSKISEPNQWQLEKSISDFQVIKYNNFRLSATQFNLVHEECLKFITSELQHATGKTVVVTHHVPTLMHYTEKYKGDVLNEAFAVELFDLIESTGPDYWIYGHHHCNTPDFEIGKTRMITNQLGYVKYGEHHQFNSMNSLEL